MTKQITTRRKYDSSHRQAQAKETRRLVAEAARDLFFERGYNGTTIDAIAQSAGVSSDTVYAVFGSKRKILHFLINISVGGDDQPVRLLDRQEPQSVLHDADPRHQIEMFAHGITEIMSRAALLFEVMRTAAKTEKDISHLLHRLLRERLENMSIFIKHLAGNNGLREGLSSDSAAQLAWTMTSAEVFLLLTRDLNYSTPEYRAWLEGTLVRLLLP